ncbi:hypothetical protein MNBD_IGNAVI01-588 [hydrothermal vent metagenome]|uniref:Uncharacterized protein n=1 Tax=hydrothermal vent metagenome TaxID=652676 RepID=A0A3B1DAA5_9ZZZZ
MIKIFVLLILILNFTSCSLFLGGVVYLDNSVNKGEREIKLEQLSKIKEGGKIVLELNDSTKITGFYKSIKNFDEGHKQDTMIYVIDKDKIIKTVNISDINKYYYVDEGGNVWFAVAMGAAIDLLIYGIISTNGIGAGGAMFMGPM